MTDVFSTFGEGLALVFTWESLLILLLGVLIGSIFGALPGLGGSIAMAILLPLTLLLEGHQALIFLISIYNGAMYGGSISAILINVPGTPGAAATTFDGYPLSKMGRATEALSNSALSSAAGGFIATLIAVLMTPFLLVIVLTFTSPDYFLIAVLGISMIAFVSKGDIPKGLVAGAFGFLLTTVGIATTVPDLRYTFGSLQLYDGLSFIAILIGVFAIAEMMKLTLRGGTIAEMDSADTSGNIRAGVLTVINSPVTVFKSALIGIGVGSVPGAGSSVANFIAYTEQSRSDSNPDIPYGEGNPKGITAAESSNNANVTGSIVPTIAFGIPGSAAAALLLGGIILHGYTPGPSMFGENLPITYSIFVSLFVSAGVIATAGVLLVSHASYLTKINTEYIIPVVVVMSFFGAYAVRYNFIDVVTVAVFGVVGYFMVKENYSVIAFVLGSVLGGIAEANFLRSLQISGGSYAVFVERPLSILLVSSIVLILLGPSLKRIWRNSLSKRLFG